MSVRSGCSACRAMRPRRRFFGVLGQAGAFERLGEDAAHLVAEGLLLGVELGHPWDASGARHGPTFHVAGSWQGHGMYQRLLGRPEEIA